MKKVISLLLAFVLCASLCACGDASAQESTQESTQETQPQFKTPTVQSTIDGIKNEFKDPDSVQMSDVCIARVKVDGVESKTEFYIIGTVRAKNSFGGYGDPQAYIIHCDNGKYEIVGEYNDANYAMQKTFNELGCGGSWSIE